MPGIQLSAEICGRILQYVGARPKDIAALCRTCKAFQREAETRLYDTLFLSDATRAHLACQTLIENERLALLVHMFWFVEEFKRSVPLSRSFWLAIQGAMAHMHNLENLALYDTAHMNTWIFDSPQIKFQLHDAIIRFTWDAYLIKFLDSQRKLQRLHTTDQLEDVDRWPLSPGALPVLKNFDGTVMVAMNMLSCPLSHLQMVIEQEVLPYFLDLLPSLRAVHKTIRSLSLLELPEELLATALSIICSACPNLAYIGLIPYPPIQRQHMYRSLIYMHNLKAIQLDLAGFKPHPESRAQRAIATEIRMFCPSIIHVIFWIKSMRYRWQWHEEQEVWISSLDTHQHPQFDNSWASHIWT